MHYRQVNPKDIKTLRQGFENACVYLDGVAELHEFDQANDPSPLKVRHYLAGDKAEHAEAVRNRFIDELHRHLSDKSLKRDAAVETAVQAAIERASLSNWANHLEVLEMRDFVRDLPLSKRKEKKENG
ncbi:MAG: hypothetical protein WCX64_05755 [Candidatus Micrarchaeia archaeon]